MSFDAGSIAAKLELNIQGWQKSVDAVKKDQDNLAGLVMRHEQSIKNLGKTLTVVGGAITAAFGLMIKKTADYGDELDDLRQRTGISVDVLSSFTLAVAKTDLGTAGFAVSLKFLANNMADANAGSTAAVAKFNQLGVSFKNADGTLRPLDQVMLDVADKFKAMPDGAQKSALAVDLFGRAGTGMIHMLNLGRDGLQAEMDKAKELGLVMTNEAAGAADKFSESLVDLKGGLQGIGIQVGNALMPALTSLVDKVTGITAKIVAWEQEHPGLAAGLSKVALGLGVLLAAIGPVIYALPGLVKGIQAVKALGSAPIIIAVALAGAALVIAEGQRIADKYDQLRKEGQSPWQAFTTAIEPFREAELKLIALRDATIDLKGAGNLLAAAFNAVKGAFDAAATPLALLTGIFKDFGLKTKKELTDELTKAEAALKLLKDSVESTPGQVEVLEGKITALKVAMNGSGEAAKAAGEAVKKAAEEKKKYADSIQAIIDKALPEAAALAQVRKDQDELNKATKAGVGDKTVLAQAMDRLVQQEVKLLTKTPQITDALLKLAETNEKDVVPGLIDMAKHFPEVAKAVEKTEKVMTDMSRIATDAMKNVASAIVNALNLTKLFGAEAKKIKFDDTYYKALTKAATDAYNKQKSLIDANVAAIKTALDKELQAIAKTYDGIEKAASKAYDKIKAAAKTAFDQAEKAADKAFDAVSDAAQAAYEAAESAAKSAFDAASDAARSAFDAIEAKAQDAYDAAGKAAARSYEKQTKAAQSAFDAQSKAIQTAYDVEDLLRTRAEQDADMIRDRQYKADDLAREAYAKAEDEKYKTQYEREKTAIENSTMTEEEKAAALLHLKEVYDAEVNKRDADREAAKVLLDQQREDVRLLLERAREDEKAAREEVRILAQEAREKAYDLEKEKRALAFEGAATAREKAFDLEKEARAIAYAAAEAIRQKEYDDARALAEIAYDLAKEARQIAFDLAKEARELAFNLAAEARQQDFERELERIRAARETAEQAARDKAAEDEKTLLTDLLALQTQHEKDLDAIRVAEDLARQKQADKEEARQKSLWFNVKTIFATAVGEMLTVWLTKFIKEAIDGVSALIKKLGKEKGLEASLDGVSTAAAGAGSSTATFAGSLGTVILIAGAAVIAFGFLSSMLDILETSGNFVNTMWQKQRDLLDDMIERWIALGMSIKEANARFKEWVELTTGGEGKGKDPEDDDKKVDRNNWSGVANAMGGVTASANALGTAAATLAATAGNTKDDTGTLVTRADTMIGWLQKISGALGTVGGKGSTANFTMRSWLEYIFNALPKAASGYVSTQTEAVMVHGTNSDPEYIFRASQLNALGRAGGASDATPSIGGSRTTVNINGPLIATSGVSESDLERAGERLFAIIERQARRTG